MSASVAFDGPSPGNRLAKRRDQPDQLRTVHVDMRDELVLGSVGDVVAERLGEELVRGGEILLAVPEQHTRARVERGPRRLGDQRGLAQTGLTRDQQHLASLAAGDALERVRHRRHLGLPADHTHRWGARPTGPATAPRSCRPAERLPAHLDGLDRIGQTLQGQFPERPALVPAAPAGHQPHDVGREDLSALARRAEPSRLDRPGRRSSRRPLG